MEIFSIFCLHRNPMEAALSVLPFPATHTPSGPNEAHARHIISHPADYAHRPQIFKFAWAILKSARAQRMVQSRLPSLRASLGGRA